MKKIILTLALLTNIAAVCSAYASNGTYLVNPKEIHSGYIIEKIWLSEYAMPVVTISGITLSGDVSLPAGAKVSDPHNIKVILGMERKRPFAVVQVPVYTNGNTGVNQVTSFALNIQEQPAAKKNGTAEKTTDVLNSALAKGTWYKIGITQTGFYKLDYAFIKSLGVNPDTINAANIRLYGNGGHPLSENNAVPRANDLLENAIQVNDGGDNVFNTGDNLVFYALGPMEWDKDSVNQRFTHLKNLYSDTAYYFISFDQGSAGLRISGQSGVPAGNVSVSSYNYYDVHELDLVNPATLGKAWYGEEFAAQQSPTQNFAFNIGAGVGSVYCKVAFAGISDISGSSFNVTLNGNSVGANILSATPPAGDDLMAANTVAKAVNCNSSTANVTITYTPIDGTGLGWLDYIEINTRRPLSISSSQFSFRDWQSVGSGNTASYTLQGADGNTRVWDVTNPQVPVVMTGTLSGSAYSFAQDAQMLHEFAVTNSTDFLAPTAIGKIANQNIHGSPQVNCIIVTSPEFLTQASQLADYHRSHDNMSVLVATTSQVYNEFSSGAQDVSAIRDLARLFYKRAGSDTTKMPKYMTLFGGASYDYKNRVTNNSNFVPVYESDESLNDIYGYSTDDFFGYLDDHENIGNTTIINALDISVGRLPARSVYDAIALVNKITSYNSPATLGPWRISSTNVADNTFGDLAGDHMGNAETMAATIESVSDDLYNEEKIYIDAIPTISTPAGSRCPNANSAIDNQVFKGTFVINYNGHGNTQVWASERILTSDDFNNWNNPNMLPFMVTATCDFGQFDHPQYVSAAEELVLHSRGGVISVLTTTAAVYANYNVLINSQYLTAQFTRNADNTWNTFGDAYRIGKNVTYLSSVSPDELANFRKFALLGDPALTPDFPQYGITMDSVLDGATLNHADTVKALGGYVISGSVRGYDGNVLTTFNGDLFVSFYDKPRTVVTISGGNVPFKVQDNIIYKGKVTVTNGSFRFSFIAPKDINYSYGHGKLSLYADNGSTDAAGDDTTVAIGGFSSSPILSSAPPIVKPYINDTLFLNGGITGSNTSLYVSLFDSTGINVSGNNLGHDLTAILDGNVEQPYILNDYYETFPNTYQRGFVSFPINGLSNGRHTIKVRAWDVNDNTGEGSVDFMVIDGNVVDIQNLMNYPNPFGNTTHFVFEHNHPDEQLEVTISIYNVSGSLVKTIKETFTPSGSRSNEITWDGTGDNGGRLASGVYVYRLNISTETGFKSSAYQKLVIVR